MNIVRYQDPQGAIHFGSQKSNNSTVRCNGGLYTGLQETNEPAQIAKLLTPFEPSQILCIGLNYRKHAEESGMKAPERPILFTKGINTVQNPGDPIEIPVRAASQEVDYECELAVVIRKAFPKSVQIPLAESGWKIDDAWPKKQGLSATLKGKFLQLDLSGEFRATIVSLRRI